MDLTKEIKSAIVHAVREGALPTDVAAAYCLPRAEVIALASRNG